MPCFKKEVSNMRPSKIQCSRFDSIN